MNLFKWYLIPGIQLIAARFSLPERKKLKSKEIHLLQQKLKERILQDENLIPLLRHDENGKPYLTDGRKISISHSENKVLIALSDAIEIGVDIQYPRKKTTQIIQRITSPEEWEIPMEQGIYNTAHFIWCAKEAVYKAHGIKGLSLRNNVRLLFANGIPVIAKVYGENPAIYRLYPAMWDESYIVLAVRDVLKE